MAKPIVVMYIPNNYQGSGWEPDILMRLLNGNFGDVQTDDEKYKLTDYWTDYYWLCFYSWEIEVPELKVFYEKDFTPIKFEELKQFIEDSLKNKP